MRIFAFWNLFGEICGSRNFFVENSAQKFFMAIFDSKDSYGNFWLQEIFVDIFGPRNFFGGISGSRNFFGWISGLREFLDPEFFFVKFFSGKTFAALQFFLQKCPTYFPWKFLPSKLSFFKVIGPYREFFSADFDLQFFRYRIFVLDLVLLEILKFQCIPLALFYLSDQSQIFGASFLWKKKKKKNL